MFAEMNANGMSLPRVPPRDAVLLEQPRRTAASARGARSSRTRRRRRTRSTRTLPAGQHRGEQRRDLGVRREPAERGHGRLRPAEREVRRHGSAGEPAPLQPTGSAPLPAVPTPTSRPTRRPTRRSSRRCTRPGRPPRRRSPRPRTRPRSSGTSASRASASAASRTRTSTRTRTRRRSSAAIRVDAGPAVRGRRDGVRARQQRARRRHDHHGRGERGRRHERQGRLGDEPGRRPAVLHRHRPEPRDRPDRGGRHRRRYRHGRDPHRAAQARARERRAVQRQPGPAGRVHGRHARAPELLRRGRAARARRRDRADRGAPAGARAAVAVHGAAGSGDDYLGAVPAPTGTVAYFETEPGQPDRDARPSPSTRASPAPSDGGTAGLQYYWDFGDGTSGPARPSPTPTRRRSGPT